MKIYRLGLITRIALLAVCVQIAAFGSLGWFYVDRFSKSYEERLYSRMRHLGHMIANDELPINTISQHSFVSDLLGAPYTYGIVIGGNGRVIVSTNPSDLGQSARNISGFDPGWIADSAREQRFIPGNNRLSAIFRFGGANGTTPLYTTVITVSTSELDAQKHAILMQGQFVSLLFILLSSAGIVLIAQRLITRRVNDSLKVLKAVEHANMDARIRINSDDELGILQQGINSMIEKVSDLLIQHRRNAEELRSTSRLLDTIIENIPNSIFLKRASDLSYALFNKAWERLYGLKREDLLGKNAYHLFTREDADHITSVDRDVLCSPTILDIPEETLTTHDGIPHILHTKKAVLFNDQNEPEYLLGISENISERKKAETDLRIAATAFESKEGQMVTDANGVILRVNQAFIKDTGYTAEEIIGQTPRILQSGRHNAAFYAEMWESILTAGSWRGEIWDRRKNGEIYPKLLSISAVKDDKGTITHFVGSHTDITDRKLADEKIQQLALHDPLTSLPNRLLLVDRLKHALAFSDRSKRTGALLFIDLDNFKVLNDTRGHYIGDMLLQQVAQRLTSCIREGDTVARLGGDEFVVLLEELSENILEAVAQAETVGDKILLVMRQTFHLDQYDFHITASIGVTLYHDNQHTLEELLKQADIAMYQAKKAGRNTLRFFEPEMQDIINSRASLEMDLRKAIENEQFVLHYQIQVDDKSRPFGAEALVRWVHPESGLISPAAFIPVAEETGLILTIGWRILRIACAQLKAWQSDSRTNKLILSVNVSAQQFRHSSFSDEVKTAVQLYDVDPALLKLEITEGMLLEDIDTIILVMSELRQFGIRFSLDDFGTGYSSLQYLKKLPLDQLKIDQSFVRDLVIDSSDKAIVSTTIAIANTLGLDVIAEGVETEEQRLFLIENGCFKFQGYLFSKPLPIERFESLLKNNY